MENHLSRADLVSESDSIDNEVLLPIASLFPANELVTKKYTLDSKPAMKLMYLDTKAAWQKKKKEKEWKLPSSQGNNSTGKHLERRIHLATHMRDSRAED